MPSIDGKTVTKFALLFALVALLAYDLFAVYRYGFDGTISVVVFTLAKSAPIIPFLVGVVVGHLFWPIEGTNDNSSGKYSGGSGKE